MRKDVCVFSESYTREELWYNDENDRFFVDCYHWGVVDDEEHFDGIKNITRTAALEKMLRYNKLADVLKYRTRLDTDNNLETVLSGMKQKSTIYDYGFLADKHMKYYKLSDTEYVIYYEGTFFTVKDGLCTADFHILKRILDSSQDILCYQYDYRNSRWTAVPIRQDLCDILTDR